jgi:hypothetical protein
VARDLSTGEEHVTIAKDPRSDLGRFAISHDGEAIAFIRSRQSGGQRLTTLEVQQSAGGPRELARAVAPSYVSLHAWTPDSKALLFARGVGTKPYRLWRIPAEGGEATDMHLSLTPTPNGISLSPDGQRIAYPERVMLHELWITPNAFATGKLNEAHRPLNRVQ